MLKTAGKISSLILIGVISLSASDNRIEEKFIKAGLINIHSIDTSIQVDLVNSHKYKNIFREDLYNGLKEAYLRKEVALKLKKAQKILKKRNPDYSLLILDAARPRSVSRKLYQEMKGTKYEKFVANPNKGSMHNYGIAVDITIVDGKREIDMGFTPFRKSKLQIYWNLFLKKIRNGPSKKEKKNRQLLADVMKQAGFYPLSFEWWHFNGMKKSEARKRYKIIE